MSLCLFEDQFNRESVSQLSPFSSVFSSLFLTSHISTFQRGTANVPIFAQIFFFCAFARSHLNMCLSPFLRSVQGGEKVEIRWRKGGERLPVVSLFLRLTLFLTPAASQHLPTLEKQKTFEKYSFLIGLLFVFRSFAR